MNEIEHFDPVFVYRPGKLQVVPDALSRMPGLRSEGEPADSDGLLQVEDDLKEGKKIGVSDLEHAKRAVEEVHLDLGHYGKSTIITTVKDRFSMPPQLLQEAAKILDACIPCQLYKPAPARTATLHPYDIKKPFEYWAIDYVGPLVKTKSGKEYLITAIDLATSTPIAHALSERSAEAAIELLEELIWTYGLPKYVLTDNGSEFRSN